MDFDKIGEIVEFIGIKILEVFLNFLLIYCVVLGIGSFFLTSVVVWEKVTNPQQIDMPYSRPGVNECKRYCEQDRVDANVLCGEKGNAKVKN